MHALQNIWPHNVDVGLLLNGRSIQIAQFFSANDVIGTDFGGGSDFDINCNLVAAAGAWLFVGVVYWVDVICTDDGGVAAADCVR